MFDRYPFFEMGDSAMGDSAFGKWIWSNSGDAPWIRFFYPRPKYRQTINCSMTFLEEVNIYKLTKHDPNKRLETEPCNIHCDVHFCTSKKVVVIFFPGPNMHPFGTRRAKHTRWGSTGRYSLQPSDSPKSWPTGTCCDAFARRDEEGAFLTPTVNESSQKHIGLVHVGPDFVAQFWVEKVFVFSSSEVWFIITAWTGLVLWHGYHTNLGNAPFERLHSGSKQDGTIPHESVCHSSLLHQIKKIQSHHFLISVFTHVYKRCVHIHMHAKTLHICTPPM